MDVASLHLSDEVLELLRSGKINNRLLCEMMTHPRFRQLMADIEIVVDRIADMRIQDMNTVLEVARQKVMKEYAPDEMDVYMRTLEVAQINETDYFSYIIHEDMDEITETIRENHRKDTTTADETTPTQDGIKMLMHSNDGAFETALCSDADPGGENHRGRSPSVQKHVAEVQAVQETDEHARERWTR